MYNSVYDLKDFYNGKVGRVVRRILQERIRDLWPDVHGLRVAGFGYAAPYLRSFTGEAERVFAVIPAGRGAHHWPQNSSEKNLTCLAEETELPFETNSIDRLLLVHDLEFSEHIHASLQEIWRVLKSSGRLLVIVPNRTGLWARTDWAPFGHGTPYSAGQICTYLRDNGFTHERTEEALFIPPLQYSLFLKSAGVYEEIGRKYLPIVAGVHMVEASKQLYARAAPGSGTKIRVRGRGVLPDPVASSSSRT